MHHCSDLSPPSDQSAPHLIRPVRQLKATVRVPGSKSLTQRALLTAALAKGVSHLLHPLACEDTHVIMAALATMGIICDTSDPECWLIHGQGGEVLTPKGDIFLDNNGTATRFLSSFVALGSGDVRITGCERMQQRPMGELILALRGWGVDIVSEAQTDCPPLKIRAHGIDGGRTTLRAGESSQYLSSLLLIAPYARQDTKIEVQGELPSRPYVDMTLDVMKAFGMQVEERELAQGRRCFRVPIGCYQPQNYAIEGDFSSASYFWAAAAITGGQVTVDNLSMLSNQGDKGFLLLLERMGCALHQQQNSITVLGSETLQAIEADMGTMPDVAPTLAIVAAFAEGRSVISNIAALRIKESDRIHTVVEGLRRLGATVEEEKDRIIIHGQQGGGNLHGARIRSHNDHRIAMSFAVAGLSIAGVEVESPDCVAKSFPGFWQRFDHLQTS